MPHPTPLHANPNRPTGILPFGLAFLSLTLIPFEVISRLHSPLEILRFLEHYLGLSGIMAAVALVVVAIVLCLRACFLFWLADTRRSPAWRGLWVLFLFCLPLGMLLYYTFVMRRGPAAAHALPNSAT